MDETKNNTENQEAEQALSRLEGELKTRFDLLPTELQEVITSSDYQTKLFEIAKKYKLTYDKLGQLELETTMVLLGMTPPDEFKLDISEQLKVDDATINNIVKDLNDQIFTPIRQQLMGVYSPEAVEAGEKFANDVTMVQENPIAPKTPVATETPVIIKTNPSAQNTIQTTPTVPTQETPTAPAPMRVDPYRELPDVPAGTGVADPVEIKQPVPKGSIDTSFLKDITPLSAVEKNTSSNASSFIDKTKDLGGLTTMNNPMGQKKVAETVTTNGGETLKKIQGLKDALLGDTAQTPIVQKEIIETAPKMDAASLQNALAKSAPVENPVQKTEAPLGASLKENPLSYREPIETAPSKETVQKIDSLINMKKLEFFTENKAENKTTPDASFAAAPAIEQNPKGIYDGDISKLQGQVSKTGFFAKMKNFFGSKNKNTVQPTETSAIPQTPPTPAFSGKEVLPKGPIDDSLVDNVKIFDETPIQK